MVAYCAAAIAKIPSNEDESKREKAREKNEGLKCALRGDIN